MFKVKNKVTQNDINECCQCVSIFEIEQVFVCWVRRLHPIFCGIAKNKNVREYGKKNGSMGRFKLNPSTTNVPLI